MIVDIDGDGDAFRAGFEPSERGLLVGDDEWSLGGGDRRGGQQQSGENEDREAEIRIRHHCFEGEEWSWRSEENWDSISELGFTFIVISDHYSII